MTIVDTLKRFFSRSEKPSHSPEETWEALTKNHSEFEFRDDLSINAGYALRLTHEERQRYLRELMKRRNAAHYADLDK